MVFVSAPLVALDDDGDAFATWFFADPISTSIDVAPYSTSTRIWGGIESLATGATGFLFFPNIATNASGSFFDVWSFVQLPNVTIQGSHINLLKPPASISGKRKTNRFPVESEIFNQIKWTASPSPSVVAYEIFRNGKLIATVSANVLQYQDHNRSKKAKDAYSVVAVSASGAKSTPVTIIIP